MGQVGEGNLRQTVLQMLYHVREVNKASQKSILIFILAIDDVDLECNGVSFCFIMSQVIMKLVLKANGNMPSSKNDFKANLLLRRQDYDKDGRQDCIGVTTNFVSILDDVNHFDFFNRRSE